MLVLGVHHPLPRHKQRCNQLLKTPVNENLPKVHLLDRSWQKTAVFLRVIKRTLESLKALAFFACLRLVHQRMELLFFPSVTVVARLEPFAALIVWSNEGPALPVLTYFDFVLEQVRAASEVLEVVGIDTLSFVVVVVERTPFSFKVEHKKVEVLTLDARHQMVD